VNLKCGGYNDFDTGVNDPTIYQVLISAQIVENKIQGTSSYQAIESKGDNTCVLESENISIYTPPANHEIEALAPSQSVFQQGAATRHGEESFSTGGQVSTISP